MVGCFGEWGEESGNQVRGFGEVNEGFAVVIEDATEEAEDKEGGGQGLAWTGDLIRSEKGEEVDEEMGQPPERNSEEAMIVLNDDVVQERC